MTESLETETVVAESCAFCSTCGLARVSSQSSPFRLHSSAQMTSNDPNHPEHLDIKPSSIRHATGTARDADSLHTRCSTWETDTTTDIEKWGIAGRIWEAAYLQRQYLKPPSADTEFDPPCPLFGDEGSRKPRNILELGSGVGYVGIACAQELRRTNVSHKDTVILTDLDNVCDLMTRNALDAGFSTEREDDAVSVIVRPLPWGSEAHVHAILAELSRPLDCVLCSDLVYFPELLPPLLRSLIHLTQIPSEGSSESPPVIIAYKIRSLSKEQPFWNILGIWFEVQIVHCRYRHPADSASPDASTESHWGPWHRFGSFMSDLEGTHNAAEEGSEDDYFIFIAQRKSSTFLFNAPAEDDRLMNGWMLASGGDTLVRGQGGADWLEWALMGSLAV